MRATLFADGGSRGNPGPAAFGAVLVAPEGEVLREVGAYLGVATNNVAEWSGLIAGLQAARELGVSALSVRLDSELVVRQLSGAYRVKDPKLVGLHAKAKKLLAAFAEVDVEHIRRKHNALADAVVNRVLDDVMPSSSGPGDDARPAVVPSAPSCSNRARGA